MFGFWYITHPKIYSCDFLAASKLVESVQAVSETKKMGFAGPGLISKPQQFLVVTLFVGPALRVTQRTHMFSSLAGVTRDEHTVEKLQYSR